MSTRRRAIFQCAITIVCATGMMGCARHGPVKWSPDDRLICTLCGLSDRLAAGKMSVLDSYSDSLRVRIGQETFSVGNNGLLISAEELSRVAALNSSHVIAGVIRVEQRAFVLDYGRKTCLGRPAEMTKLIAALNEAEALISSARERVLPKETGEWRSFLASRWSSVGDAFYTDLDLFLKGRSSDVVVRELLAWYRNAGGDLVSRAHALNAKRFGLIGGIKDQRSLTLLVIAEALELPAGILLRADRCGYGSLHKYEVIAIAMMGS